MRKQTSKQVIESLQQKSAAQTAVIIEMACEASAKKTADNVQRAILVKQIMAVKIKVASLAMLELRLKKAQALASELLGRLINDN